MRLRRRALFTVAAASVAVAAGCGDDITPSGTAGGTSAAAAAGSYDFTATTLDGATFDGHSLKGRPAVLWFWAPWCPTCLMQAKHVNALAAEYAGKVTVLGVAGLDKIAAMHDFVRLAKLSGFTQLADEEGVVWKLFGMTEQSTFVVLDTDGTVTDRGKLDVAGLPRALDRLVAG